MKVLWFDVETTGLDPVKNDIITLAMIIEIDGEVKDFKYIKMQPTNFDNIEDQALKVNGVTREELKNFMTPKQAHQEIKGFLGQFVDPFDRNDKYQPAGYNVGFDVGFLAEFFKKVGDKYFGSWIDYHKLDVSSIVQLLALKNNLKLDKYRLLNVANHFGVKIEAHDALSDIEATREVCYKILDQISFKEETV